MILLEILCAFLLLVPVLWVFLLVSYFTGRLAVQLQPSSYKPKNGEILWMGVILLSMAGGVAAMFTILLTLAINLL